MKKVGTLMGKWWFRLILIIAVAVIVFIVSMCIIPSDRETVKYINDGTSTLVSVLLVYPACILMYFATDIMSDMKLKIGKVLRKILFIISLVLFVAGTLIGWITYLTRVDNASGAMNVIQPFFDGLGLAPVLTYAFLYFFVVGRYEVIGDREPKRVKQFVLTLIGLLAPIAVGIIALLILKIVGNVTVVKIAIAAILVLIAIGFIISFKKYGFFLGGIKEFDRDKPKYSPSSGFESTDGEWENKFKEKIENYAYGAYKTATVYASLYEGTISVTVKIDYFGSSNGEIIAKSINEMINDVKSAYKSVAKKCPYPSKLQIETK